MNGDQEQEASLPKEFEKGFRAIKTLAHRRIDVDRGVWLVESKNEARIRQVIKVSSMRESPDQHVLERLCLRKGKPPCPNISSLSAFGKSETGLHYEFYEYYPLGSLADHLRGMGALSATACLDLVRHIANALSSLHNPVEEKYIIHGDVKPSNIFIKESGESKWQYLLGDFNAAKFATTTELASASGRYTPRYAAPEMLSGGAISQSVDYWALGIVVLECITGKHPLDSLAPQVIRRIILSWKPDFRPVEDSYWRALLGGLLERSPDSRWGADDIKKWLDRDPVIISKGLGLAGESASSVPFTVAGKPVHSARGLAEAMLRNWQVVQ